MPYPKTRLIHGVAHSDVRPVSYVDENGKKKIFRWYQTWKGMLGRCYDTKLLERNQTYIGCSVCDEWLYASNFKRWYEEQGNVDNLCIDKDFLSEDNRVYSPDTCVFLTHEMNTQIVKVKRRGKDAGDMPLGVTLVPTNKYKKYVAHISIKNKRKTVGYYYTPEEAHQAYLQEKKKHLMTFFPVIDGMDVNDEMKNKIKKGFSTIINNM